MASVLIAHLSDPHLPLTGLPSWREWRIKRVLSLLSWHTKRKHVHVPPALEQVMQDIHQNSPDLVALTGDMTNLGLADEFRAAQQWLKEQNLPPTLLVPGNHDAMVRENSSQKRALWTDWLHPQNNEKAPSVLIREHVALVGLNTAVPTFPFLATGRAGQEQLDLLASTLKNLGLSGLCRIVLLHHPPVAKLVGKRKGLVDLNTLQDILRQEGAEMVLHGHSHRATACTIPGTRIPVIGTTSASHIAGSPDKAAGWNRITVTPHPRTWEISVQRRALGTDGSIHDNQATKVYTLHRHLTKTAV
ncbi:metallophosphoesterase family protein [Acetobacter syzygii]|uniref:metallophosphoesterase family protein n=1 Tax=Acetobacter syzygii TaxID=146476 RepID=UPI0039E95B96